MAKIATTAKNKLESALATHFAGADIRLTGFTRGKRIGGTLIWDGFVGVQQIDRQVDLRRIVDDALPREEQLQVSFILTVTPEEFASIIGDSAAKSQR